MVIRKSDVLSADAGHVQQALTKYEAKADARLEHEGHYTIRLEGEPSRFRSVIGEELKRRYEQAGWVVKIQQGSCQRDGDWYNVAIS